MSNESMENTLNQILHWINLCGKDYLINKIKKDNLIKNEKELIAYQNSDGERSIRDLVKLAGISRATIQNLWKQWVMAGIAEPTEKYSGGRCRRLFEINIEDISFTTNNKKEPTN